jgi:hypothetical protein
MRRHLALTILTTAVLATGGTYADDVIMKDGRTLRTLGPPAVKGRMAILKTADGRLLSVPIDEIDMEKTTAARLKPTPVPVPTATPLRPLTPAEAARIRSGKKATVVLTDDEVAGAMPVSDDPASKEAGEERIDVSNASAVRTKGGYKITGSLLNSGKVELSGVSVTIEAIGPENKTLVSGFGQLSKDQLAPGEKATFQTMLATESEALTFRYVPSWQVKLGVKGAAGGPDAGSGAAANAPGGGEKAAGGVVPTPTVGPIGSQVGQKGEKAPEAAPTPIPRPDMPLRPPNAAVGAPERPGGTFIPKPTGDQPKPPTGN